jgi:hypothetical protein
MIILIHQIIKQMKKVLLVISLFISTNVFCQLKEVEPLKSYGVAKRMGILMSEIQYTTPGDYIWKFNNTEYKTLTSYSYIKFNADEETMNKLYQIFKEQIEAEKGSKKEFQLGETLVLLKTSRAFGISSLEIYTPKGTTNLSSKEIDKLFNKSDDKKPE